MDDYTFWRDQNNQLRGYPKSGSNGTLILATINNGGQAAFLGSQFDNVQAASTLPSTRTSVLRLNLSRARTARDNTLEALALMTNFVAEKALSDRSSSSSFNYAITGHLHKLLLQLGRRADGSWDATMATATLEDLLAQVDVAPLKRQRMRRRDVDDVIFDLIGHVRTAHCAEQEEAEAMDEEATAEPVDTPPTAAAAVDELDLCLLDLLHAPADSYLHSLASTLARIENLSHILAWATYSSTTDASLPAAFTQRSLRFVMLPRLKLTFEARRVQGTVRLYSIDHAELFISNAREEPTLKLLNGIPHSLLLSSSNGEQTVLVPSWKPQRPAVNSEPFSTALVLDRSNQPWSAAMQPYYLYSVHVSLCFLCSSTHSSALYLLLLRLLARQYAAVAELVETCACDTALEKDTTLIFTHLNKISDSHPDFFACQLRLALVMLDSPSLSEYGTVLSQSIAAYISRVAHVSANCCLTVPDECRLLNQFAVTSSADPKAQTTPITKRQIVLMHNRRASLRAQASESLVQELKVPARPTESRWIYQWLEQLDHPDAAAQLESLLATLTIRYTHKATYSLDDTLSLISSACNSHKPQTVEEQFLLLFSLFQGEQTEPPKDARVSP